MELPINKEEFDEIVDANIKAAKTNFFILFPLIVNNL